MKFRAILTSIMVAYASTACAQVKVDDSTILEMAQAFQKGNKARLTQLLPQARGHMLEPWAAYWELNARLDTATPQEVPA